MNGKIEHIHDPGGTRPKYGFIMGDDNVKYYFNGKLLSDGYSISDMQAGEPVYEIVDIKR